MSKDLLNEPWFLKSLGLVAAQAPAFAGAVVSLAFIGRLSSWGRIVAVIIGAVTAVYVSPAISDFIDLFWPGEMPTSIAKAVQFLVSLSAMGALPELLMAIKKASGDPLGIIERFMPARKAPPANGEGDQ